MITRTLLRTVMSAAVLAASTAWAEDAPPLKPEELEQLAAPIALYPDSLVSQVLMASTYPLEVVQAERFAKQNENLKGDALTEALEEEDWDPSVKSLVNFPQVLTMMNEKLDWTSQLGDAFLAQQKELMDAIQKLRDRAKDEGNLETTAQQTVEVVNEGGTEVIVIESSDPEVIYVPSYDSTVVYGAWPYPAYPPYYYYPPGYVAGSAMSWGVGFACGAAWGYAWGGCNWHHGDIDIDCDRNLRVNHNIDRSRYKNEIGSRNRNVQNGRGSWQHDPNHRKGASYRDQNTARRFGGESAADAARARDSFRGRAEAGRQDIARGGADQFRGRSQPGTVQRDRASATSRGQSTRRPDPAARGTASRQTSNRSAYADRNQRASGTRQSQGGRGSALDGAGNGSRARAESQRGQSSRQASRSSGSRSGGRGSSGYSGGSRGGGSRGGGGMRGGGGRGGRR